MEGLPGTGGRGEAQKRVQLQGAGGSGCSAICLLWALRRVISPGASVFSFIEWDS